MESIYKMLKKEGMLIFEGVPVWTKEAILNEQTSWSEDHFLKNFNFSKAPFWAIESEDFEPVDLFSIQDITDFITQHDDLKDWVNKIDCIDRYVFFSVEMSGGYNANIWKFDFSEFDACNVLNYFKGNSLHDFLKKYNEKIKLDWVFLDQIIERGKENCKINYDFRIVFKDKTRVEVYIDLIRDYWSVFGHSGLADIFLKEDLNVLYLEFLNDFYKEKMN